MPLHPPPSPTLANFDDPRRGRDRRTRPCHPHERRDLLPGPATTCARQTLVDDHLEARIFDHHRNPPAWAAFRDWRDQVRLCDRDWTPAWCPPRSKWTQSQMSEAVEKLASGRGGPVAPRRRWSDAEKRRIVTESYQPGVSVSVVARRNDVNANLVFTWRRRFREQADGAGGLVPVIVEPLPLDTAAGDAPAAGRMEIALADGLAGDCRPGGGRFGAGPGSRGSGAAMIPVPGGCPCLAGDRRDGHAARHEHACAAGPGGSRSRPSCGRSLCFPRPSRRPRKMPLARRGGDLALRQAA